MHKTEHYKSVFSLQAFRCHQCARWLAGVRSTLTFPTRLSPEGPPNVFWQQICVKGPPPLHQTAAFLHARETLDSKARINCKAKDRDIANIILVVSYCHVPGSCSGWSHSPSP